jgi:hypothetical protein
MNQALAPGTLAGFGNNSERGSRAMRIVPLLIAGGWLLLKVFHPPAFLFFLLFTRPC